MKCPFLKEVVQAQTMPSNLATPEPPKVVITESFLECKPDKCMAGWQTADDGWRCRLCGKEYK